MSGSTSNVRKDERPKLVDRVSFLLRAAEGRSVLHLGCTNHPYTESSVAAGTLLHARLAASAFSLTGLDSDQEGIAELAKYDFGPIHHADLENLDDAAIEATYDVIIAGEVIEHLTNPGGFLRGVKRFMTADSVLILTTINAYCGMRFAQYALRGRGGVAEPVHPDHVAYYSYKTLRRMVEMGGLSVEDFLFYDLGPEHRVHNRFSLNLINDVCVRIAPQLSDGLIAVCRIPE